VPQYLLENIRTILSPSVKGLGSREPNRIAFVSLLLSNYNISMATMRECASE